jgi:hypothetical protein
MVAATHVSAWTVIASVVATTHVSTWTIIARTAIVTRTVISVSTWAIVAAVILVSWASVVSYTSTCRWCANT